MNYYEGAVTVVILCIIGGGTYFFLNGIEDKTPGWSDPVVIGEDTSSLSLLLYDGIWVATEDHGEIGMYYSEDGRKWSLYPLPDIIHDFSTYEDLQWLHRPSGDVWLVLHLESPGSRGWNHCYVKKTEDTFTPPVPVMYLNEDFSSYVPDEFTIMGIRYPSGRWMGLDVTGDQSDIIVCDDPEWSLPAWLFLDAYSRTTRFSRDNTGTLWAVYTTPGMRGTTYVRRSEDRITWSTPHTIPEDERIHFFQRQNGQYLFFFVKERSAFMMVSEGTEWSEPITMTNRLERWVPCLDVAEADDGTLWAVFEGEYDIYATWFTDEQYHKDMERLQNYCTKNGIEALLFTGLLGAGWILLRRSSLYPLLERYMEDARWKGEIDDRIKVIIFLPIVFAIAAAIAFGSIHVVLFMAALFVTTSFILYIWLEGKKENIFAVVVFFISVLMYWILAIGEFTMFT